MGYWLDNIVFIIALVMIIEGIMPFLSPTRYKKMLLRMISLDDRTLRIMALVMMVVGVILLSIIDPVF
jgi:hypothetical protein